MLKFLADEHVPPALLAGLRLREPGVDIVRVQDVGLRTAADDVVFDWAARHDRVVLSEDRKTMAGDANGRIAAGVPFAGLVLYRKSASIGRLVDDLQLVANIYTPDDATTLVLFIPL